MMITVSPCARPLSAAAIVLSITGAALALPINGRVSVHRFTVGPAGTANPDATIAQDFQFANAIFNQVGIQFDNSGDTFVQANTPAAAGQWTDYQVNSTLNTVARQQGTGFAYYIVPGQSYANGTTTLAETWSQEDVGATITDPNNAANTTTVRVRAIAARGTRGGTDTVPHEFGHMLSNRFRWRTFEAAAANNTVHSGTVTDLMTPNVQNPTANQVWPQGNQTQIRNNIGRYNGASAGRVPLITSLYNDGNSAGSTAGNAMFSQINRDDFQYSMNQNSSTRVVSANWGNSTFITMPTAFGGSDHSYLVDETARRMQGSTEQLSFFITSGGGFSLGSDLGNGWSFNPFGINTLDGAYTGVVPNSVEIRCWNDILATGAFTDANGGAGVVIPTANYTAFGNLSGGAIDMNINFPTSSAGVLAGYRDMLITFNVNWTPAPGAAGLLAMAGIVAVRRRRR